MPKNMEISFLLDFYGDMLTEKQRSMVDFYYNEDLSLAEIAENEGITRQGVRDSIKRAEAQLWEMEDRLALAARFRRMQEDLLTVQEAAKALRLCNERNGRIPEIEEYAATIAAAADRMTEA